MALKYLNFAGLSTLVSDIKTWVLARIPTKTSEITNDSGFITSSSLPTVNNATLTIQKNGTNVQTFTANASSNKTANITVPTKTSELTNDSGFLTSHQSLGNYVTLTSDQTLASTKSFTTNINTANVPTSQKETWRIIFNKNSADTDSTTAAAIGVIQFANTHDFIATLRLANPRANNKPVSGNTKNCWSGIGVYYNYDENKGYPHAVNCWDWPASSNSTNELASTSWVRTYCETTKGFLTSHQSLSNYVTLNGDQTITAIKRHTTNLIFKNTAITNYKAAPSADISNIALVFTSNENRFFGAISHNYFTNGHSVIGFELSNWTTSGSQGWWRLDYGVDKAFSQVYFRPNGDNFCNLGDSSNKWKACYATNFYGALSGVPSASLFVTAVKDGGALINAQTTTFGTIWRAPTKNYQVGAATWPSINDNVLICYSVSNANVEANNNNVTRNLIWNADTGILTSTGFNGNVTGNCSGSSGSCTGLAAKATSNANGKELTNTIVKGLSISGKTITYTQIDGNTGTLTTQDTVYTHPTSAGNKHIPSGGSADQYLKYSASGTAVWADLIPIFSNKVYEWNNTVTVSTMHSSSEWTAVTEGYRYTANISLGRTQLSRIYLYLTTEENDLVKVVINNGYVFGAKNCVDNGKNSIKADTTTYGNILTQTVTGSNRLNCLFCAYNTTVTLTITYTANAHAEGANPSLSGVISIFQ